jgi:regulator of sigma E protease
LNVLIAIVGLGFLILVHEAGHFFTALAVGMRPRKFYIGFPPALVRLRRKGVEYGIGLIPLGGYVAIPGMHRPAPGDLDLQFGRALHVNPQLVGPVERGKRALRADDFEGARAAVDEIEEVASAAGAKASVERGVQSLRDGLSSDAYWRQPTWKRVIVIFAGPATNFLVAIVLFAAIYMVSVSGYRLGFVMRAGSGNAVVASVLPDRPASHAGLRAGDRIVAVNGVRITATSLRSTINASHGTPLRLTVVRKGRRLALPPVRAYHDVVKGESPPQALWSSLRITGHVTKEIGASLGSIFRARGRKQISSPVGIVRGSEEALREGFTTYLSVLGLISLSLALLNLLPLLPLDGGHIAFSIIEGLRKRAVPREVYERVSAIGIVLVAVLFFIGLSNDLGGRPGG